MRRAVMLAALLAAIVGGGIAVAADTWTTYRYPDRGFSIAFPAAPKLSKSTPRGVIPVVQYQYTLVGVNFVHEVSVVEYPPGRGVRGDGTPFLNSLVDRYAKGSGATVHARTPVTLAGHPAVEAVLQDTAYSRDHLIDLVAVQDRVYLVASVGATGSAEGPDAKHFRDSLQLLGP